MSTAMDVVQLSRLQFGLTALYHFLFVPLTLGLSILLGIMESVYVMTGKEVWRQATKFWGVLFGINFAMGVATGITMEFQFGMNWAYYSHYVGDIFGAPLAIEGLMAFFLEATFVGLFFFGWDRLSKVAHLGVTWLVAIGSNLSALWILIANGWMLHPVGAHFNPDTMRMEVTDFGAIIFNVVAQEKFVHTVSAGYVTGAMFVASVSAIYLLLGKHIEIARRSMTVAVSFGLASALSVVVLGDSKRIHGHRKSKDENCFDRSDVGDRAAARVLHSFWAAQPGRAPDRLCGADTLGAWTHHDPFASMRKCLASRNWFSATRTIFGPGSLLIPLSKNSAPTGTIRTPALSSSNMPTILAMRSFSRKSVPISNTRPKPKSQRPPGAPCRAWRCSFGRSASWSGLAFSLFFCSASRSISYRRDLFCERAGCFGCWRSPCRFLGSPPRSGWVVAEVGRQPWVVEGVLPTFLAVSSISANNVLVTLFGFIGFYSALLLVDIYLMVKAIRLGPGDIAPEPRARAMPTPNAAE